MLRQSSNLDSLFRSNLESRPRLSSSRLTTAKASMDNHTSYVKRRNKLSAASSSSSMASRPVLACRAFPDPHCTSLRSDDMPIRGIPATPRVGIIMGSETDYSVMENAEKIMSMYDVPHEVRIISAHRTPILMASYALEARDRGIQIIIAGAGGAAHLPGMVASHTCLPVIGVPVRATTMNGHDSLLSIVQMPRGVPVATVDVDNATNAGWLALRALGLVPDKEKRMDSLQNEGMFDAEYTVKPRVGIILGSDSDSHVMKDAQKILNTFDVPHEIQRVSADWTSDSMFSYASSARARGIRVIIPGGVSHHLRGIVEHTNLPVIGIPLSASTSYEDDKTSLYSTLQMPEGLPVAVVGLNNATNAGLLAVRFLGVHDINLIARMIQYQKDTENDSLMKAEKFESLRNRR